MIRVAAAALMLGVALMAGESFAASACGSLIGQPPHLLVKERQSYQNKSCDAELATWGDYAPVPLQDFEKVP